MEKHKLKNLLILCVTALLIVGAAWTIWSNTALTISSVIVSSDHIPYGFSGFKIAHVSDLHNAEFGKNNEQLLQLLSESEPDIIVVTGDLVDSNHTDINVAIEFVKNAALIAPVYYVMGNHEARLPEYEEFENKIELTGTTVLEDEAIQLERNGDKIILIGLSDPDFTIKNDVFDEVSAMIDTKLQKLMSAENEYTILLSHRPELFETYASCNADLVFSGHAHGGQFRLPFIGGVIAPNQGLFPKYDSGLYTKGNTNMIVSRGLGNSIIPIRFNNRPEIVIAELCRK